MTRLSAELELRWKNLRRATRYTMMQCQESNQCSILSPKPATHLPQLPLHCQQPGLDRLNPMRTLWLPSIRTPRPISRHIHHAIQASMISRESGVRSPQLSILLELGEGVFEGEGRHARG